MDVVWPEGPLHSGLWRLSRPHNASSAPRSSPPSLHRSVSLEIVPDSLVARVAWEVEKQAIACSRMPISLEV
jgi:hypothetical protein